MVCASERDVEGDIPIQQKGEADLEKMAHQVQSFFKLNIYYGQMDFTSNQSLAIIKAVIELIHGKAQVC